MKATLFWGALIAVLVVFSTFRLITATSLVDVLRWGFLLLSLSVATDVRRTP